MAHSVLAVFLEAVLHRLGADTRVMYRRDYPIHGLKHKPADQALPGSVQAFNAGSGNDPRLLSWLR